MLGPTRGAPAQLGAQNLAPLLTASLEYEPSRFGAHALAEAVHAGPALVLRLVRPFHDSPADRSNCALSIIKRSRLYSISLKLLALRRHKLDYPMAQVKWLSPTRNNPPLSHS